MAQQYSCSLLQLHRHIPQLVLHSNQKAGMFVSIASLAPVESLTAVPFDAEGGTHARSSKTAPKRQHGI